MRRTISTAGPLCPSLYLYGTILKTLRSTVWNRRDNAFLLANSALRIRFPLFPLFIPSMSGMCGVGVFGLKEWSYSLSALDCRLFFNNKKIYIFIDIHTDVLINANLFSMHSINLTAIEKYYFNVTFILRYFEK